MDEGPSREIRGTVRDWPASLIFIGALVWMAYWLDDATPPPLLYAIPLVGAVSWPLRRGTFTRNR